MFHILSSIIFYVHPQM